jgi:hypothetical protein
MFIRSMGDEAPERRKDRLCQMEAELWLETTYPSRPP